MDVVQIRKLVEGVKQEAIERRRYLHQHPELSFCEFKTSQYIKHFLNEQGIPFEEVAETGIIAKVTGTKGLNNNAVVLRADMDALPIQEANNSDFDSIYPNIMHACGHDFHTSNLMSALKILNQHKEEIEGVILAVFQPAEEKIPGGAKAILESGKLDQADLKIKAVLGLHVSPKFQAGQLAVRPGKFMASSDEIFVTIKGRGGHGAQPHLNIDPVVIGSQLVVSLQQLVSRIANPAVPTVLSFGKFIANGATNVIPNEVYLEGTFRTMDESWRDEALRKIEHQIVELPRIFGAEAVVEIRRGYPVLNNNVELATRLEEYLKEFSGEHNVYEAPIWMAAEDFAYYTHQLPSVFYLVGIANSQKGIGAELHTPNFQIDEDAFDNAIGGLIYSALSLLSEKK